MKRDRDQQMAFLSILKPVASSFHHVGTREPPKTKTSPMLPNKINPSIPGNREKDHAYRVRSSIELRDSNSP